MLGFGATLLLAGAAVLTIAGPGQARGPGAVHFAGHYGGFYHYYGGYQYHPYSGYRAYYHAYYGYGYHRPSWDGYYPYYYGYYYPYGYAYAAYPYGYYPYGYGYSRYYVPYADGGSWYPGFEGAYSPRVNAAGFTSVSPLSGGSEYPSTQGQPGVTAHVTARVPAGADVWINGSNTYSAGLVREFQSPPLTPGYQYTYEFRARWKNDDGREVTQTQQVAVSAGGYARVDFPIPDATGAAAPTTKGP
jgi:uncharacterized protein (TIGR03000 family)